LLAHLHVVAQTYTPSVRFQAPEGLTYVIVQEEKAERRECGAANERFLRPIKEGCRDCKIVSARCERVIEGLLEREIYEAKAIPHPTVVAPGMRMAIIGPQAAADKSCDLIALAVAQRGLRPASCIHPTPRKS
jgi:hypothetical protein